MDMEWLLEHDFSATPFAFENCAHGNFGGVIHSLKDTERVRCLYGHYESIAFDNSRRCNLALAAFRDISTSEYKESVVFTDHVVVSMDLSWGAIIADGRNLLWGRNTTSFWQEIDALWPGFASWDIIDMALQIARARHEGEGRVEMTPRKLDQDYSLTMLHRLWRYRKVLPKLESA